MRIIKAKIIYRVITLSLSLGLAASVLAADFTTTKALAEQGNALAQYELAEKYDSGEEVPFDPGIAAEWYTKAAEQGNVQAQYKLGNMYYYGMGGLPQDYSITAKWYEKAAIQGDIVAQIDLAQLYTAEGELQDHKNAMYWRQMAADQGSVYSQSYLAML